MLHVLVASGARTTGKLSILMTGVLSAGHQLSLLSGESANTLLLTRVILAKSWNRGASSHDERRGSQLLAYGYFHIFDNKWES